MIGYNKLALTISEPTSMICIAIAKVSNMTTSFPRNRTNAPTEFIAATRSAFEVLNRLQII